MEKFSTLNLRNDLKKVYEEGKAKIETLKNDFEKINSDVVYNDKFKMEQKEIFIERQAKEIGEINKSFLLLLENFKNKETNYKKLIGEDLKKLETYFVLLKNESLEPQDLSILLENSKDNYYIIDLVIKEAKNLKTIDYIKELLKIENIKNAVSHNLKIKELLKVEPFSMVAPQHDTIDFNYYNMIFDWHLNSIEDIETLENFEFKDN